MNMNSETVMGSILKNHNNVALFLVVFLRNSAILRCDQGEFILIILKTQGHI